MENNLSKFSRVSQPHSSNSSKQSRSGYEPSDTETDWQDSPQQDRIRMNGVVGLPQNPKMDMDLARKTTSPLKLSARHSSRFEDSAPKKDSAVSPIKRRHSSKSPYKGRPREDIRNISPLPLPPGRRNVSPFTKPELGRQVSPYKLRGKDNEKYHDYEISGSTGRRNQKTPTRDERSTNSQFCEVTRASERLSHSRRSITPGSRSGREDQENKHLRLEEKRERTPSPLSRNMINRQKERKAAASHTKASSIGELNEMVANMKMSGNPVSSPPNFESTDSISPGDIFFSRDHTALAKQKNGIPNNGNIGTNIYSRFPHVDSVVLHQRNKANGYTDHNPPRTPISSSQTIMNSSSGPSMKSSGKLSNSESSKISDASGRTSGSSMRFTAKIKKSQAENIWFSCMRRGPCKTSRSPERQSEDEALYIEKAFVVESLRQFWADKHQPSSLSGFTCHKQEAQVLKQLASNDSIPHILLKGPSGSGKRTLAMALLSEIFGEACWNVSHDWRYFPVQDKRAVAQVVVPLTSSPHHVELNVNLELNAKYALMGLVKEISNTYAMTPEVSNINFKADYKVIVLYQVDKAAENIQHLIKWIMDCYTDACKLILCCEDDIDIIDLVKNRCKVVKVDAPVTHEIMEVLIQIARKEEFELPMSFAAKIASKSKQNLRKAIMALEACKAHNYPFADDQPIPFGWEEVLVELAAEILADPSPKRLFFVREKFQKLLVDFVHPKLILQKLVEQFLKGLVASSKRELYYWHAYYEKRLPTGTTALLKLEEFVAKFMSMYRKSSSSRQYA